MIKTFKVQEKDFSSDLYHPIFTFDEGRRPEHTYYVLRTDCGDIFLSYYGCDHPPQYLCKGSVLFLAFGTSCAVVNLGSKKILYHQKGSYAMISEIIDLKEQQTVLMNGSRSVKQFDCQGKLISEGIMDKGGIFLLCNSLVLLILCAVFLTLIFACFRSWLLRILLSAAGIVAAMFIEEKLLSAAVNKAVSGIIVRKSSDT